MQFESLKIFCDVVRWASFSRGAAENDISQSSASEAVHQLEVRLGVKLIDRSKRPLILTSQGKVYYEGCKELVERYIELENRVKALIDEGKVLGTVGFASMGTVEIRELDGEPFVAFDGELAIRRAIDRCLHHHDVNVEVVLEFDNIENIKRAVEIPAGVSILPEPSLAREVRAGALAAVRISGQDPKYQLNPPLA